MSGVVAASLFLLSAWISQITGLPVIKEPPQIVLTNRGAGLELSDHCTQSKRCTVNLCVTYRGTIYCYPGWDPSRAFDRMYLAHELTHVMQDVSKRRYPCEQAREREAYWVQWRWAELHGLDFWKETGFSQEELRRIVTCPGWKD